MNKLDQDQDWLQNQISVLNSPGTIDDYRGELKVILINFNKILLLIHYAQMVLCPIVQAKLKEVDSLDDTDRGSGGFGSTGLK